ncbi:thiol:disulfide interchange protein DsbA/DsbL [Rheinheimera sp. D18]|uniref:thiol:disulfide interchange protein DsbA/DsbL n=1 Tax=Rheinheimera sp. D18 TaxID=2545632 RepID=UPI0010496EBA|nr:thiol:disulfide interchange protein DsbA/DsbL [Rheinheimera sp. D18]QBL10778.1 thiol:disulfide interchange protein DsbA/DsbL [Rheinheimera sp. D18]
MKSIFIALALLLPLTSINAATFVEGKHYEVIAAKASPKAEVKEYFSFYCGGCNAFEPVAQSVAKKLPEGVEFKKSHVDFIRAASPELQNAMTRAYIVAKGLGKGDAIASAFFNQIHRNRAPFSNEGEIRSLILLNDIDAETYDKAMKSFSVRGAASQMKKEQEELSESRVLNGVPMLIVSGKYKINQAALNRNNLETELLELINFLLEKENTAS